MTITLEINGETERRLLNYAAQLDQTPEETALPLLTEALLEVYVRPAKPPEWIWERVASDKDNWLADVIGQWPGDETDEEIDQALKDIS